MNAVPHSAVHATFTVERIYDASPARVFAALSQKEAKERWFRGPGDWVNTKHEMDFRVGGREINWTGPKGSSRKATEHA